MKRRKGLYWFGCGLQHEHHCVAKSKITTSIAAYLDRKLEEDDEVTSVQLQRLTARNISLETRPSTIKST